MEVERLINEAGKALGYTLRPRQLEIVNKFVSGYDVFVSLPTGSGKSLCYFVLPNTFNMLRETTESIVIVVSPLVALMKEQAEKLNALSAKAVYVGDLMSEDRESVCAGDYQFVFMSPESLLTDLEWREMLLNSTYERNLVGLIVDEAHCVKQW